MIARWMESALTRSPPLRRWCWRRFYRTLSSDPERSDLKLMNFGYRTLGGEPLCKLSPERERYRHQIQLYHLVAKRAGVTGRDVLEVSSGRGGGCSHVMRALRPRSMVGVELSDEAVAFARREFGESGLEFRQGDAEDLPFGDESFDVVLNVEASHCYGSFARFLREAHRVTRPGGRLSFCDLRLAREIAATRRALASSGFDLLEERLLTESVVAALDADSAVKEAEIRNDPGVPSWAKRAFMELSGVSGTRICEDLRAGRREFLYALLRKPPAGRVH